MTLSLKWQISQSACQFTKTIIFQEFKEMCSSLAESRSKKINTL